MTERLETIQNLIKEVADILRETRKIQIDETRLIRRSDAEIAIQKLNSVTELLKKDLTITPKIEESSVDAFKKIIEEQRNNKKWFKPYTIDYEPFHYPDPRKPWWQQGATANLKGVII